MSRNLNPNWNILFVFDHLPPRFVVVSLFSFILWISNIIYTVDACVCIEKGRKEIVDETVNS